MKRRILCLLCLLCILVSCVPLHVGAANDCGENATWSLSEAGVLTISGTGPIRDYIYEGANLWPNIKAPWREQPSKVRQIIIEPGITAIGDNAFCGLTNLTSVSIPNTVTRIGQAAFHYDTKLNNVVIPDSVTYMEQSVFGNCSSLSSIKLSANLTFMGGQTFEHCSNLSSITLPAGLSVIGGRTFASCPKLKSITLPEGITEITNFAFAYSGLTSITLPSTLKKICPNAFWCCDLTQITFPAGTMQILQNAFGGCYNLKRIQFLGSAPDFDSHAFESVTATVYYPKDDPSWTEAVRQNYGGTLTWVGCCGNGHTWGQWQEDRKPTCSQTGLQSRGCTKCDITEEASIAMVPHRYEAQVTPPTCKEDGYTTYTCAVCANSYRDDPTPAGPHAYGEWVVLLEPTCLEKGSREHGCIACDVKETEELAPYGHSYQATVTPPSCTEQGYTTHVCQRCRDSYEDAVTAVTPHSFGPWLEVKAPSWLEEGEAYRSCADCTAQEQRVLEKEPVNWGLILGIAAGVLAVAGVGIAVARRKSSRSPR